MLVLPMCHQTGSIQNSPEQCFLLPGLKSRGPECPPRALCLGSSAPASVLTSRYVPLALFYRVGGPPRLNEKPF